MNIVILQKGVFGKRVPNNLQNHVNNRKFLRKVTFDREGDIYLL